MEQLYIRRNISECLGAAWTLMSTNLSRIVKALWIPVLIYALATAIIAPMSLTVVKSQVLGQSPLCSMLTIVICSIICIAAALTTYAKTFRLLNGLTFKHCMTRALKSFVIVAIFFIIVFAVYFAILATCATTIAKGILPQTIGTITTIIISIIFAILAYAVYCPLNYCITKYMTERETVLKYTFKSYRLGMRSLGFLVGSSLLCLLVMATIYNVTALPAYIATLAATLSNEGLAKGDESGLPAWFPLVYGLTTFVSGIVYMVLTTWYTLVTYYQYASIEARNGKIDSQTDENEKTNG